MNMNQKDFANIILVVVVVTLLGAVGYFAFVKKSEPVAQQPTPTPTPTQTKTLASPTPTPSNISVLAGRTAYKNSVNSFTFNYPASWYLESDPSNAAILRSLPSSGGSGQGLLGQNEIGIEITQSASNNTQEVKAWCENNIAHFQFATLTAQFSNGHYTTVGGSNAYSVDYQIKEDARLNGRQICVAKGNDKFILVAYPLNSTLLSDFDKIVASFKFTNKKVEVGTEPTSIGTVQPEDPNKAGLVLYPDLLITSLPTEPVSVKFVVEHRSALNGKSIKVRGVIVGTLLGEKACPPDRGMCAQPNIFLADTTAESRNKLYDLRVLVSEEEQEKNYLVGSTIEIQIVADGSKVAVVAHKTY